MGGRRRRRRAAEDSPAKTSSSSSSGGSTEQPSPPPPPSPGAKEARRRPRQDTRALRRRLLAMIRGYYLDAISRLPTADLRRTLVRGLLVGGHCFGPLHPVHNIIANAVWYAAAFPLPPGDQIEVDVICTQATDRAVRRSLDGLVACLRHLCPFLSLEDALWQLSLSRSDLRVAVASARRASPPSLPGAARPEEVRAAFEVAAETARHPNPAALALFASSVLPAVESHVCRLLVSKRSLSGLDIDCLSGLLLPYPLPDELSSPRPRPDPSPLICKFISDKQTCVKHWYECLLGIAEAALCKFAHQTGLHYELHTIYGESLLKDEDYHDHFHINFMARPPRPGPGVEAGPPLFFFAEASDPLRPDFREEDISLCCVVKQSPGDTDNCLACLVNQHKINHPAVQPVGQSHVLLLGGQCYEIDKTDHDWDLERPLDVEYLFFDPDRDNDLVEDLHNEFARIDAYCSNLSDDEDDGPPPVDSFCRQLV
ncbi:hypothetical protein ACP70R_013209 [Stipagrostis hirtigluma subsp. patula]